MKKLKLDMSGMWVVCRQGKYYKICAGDGSDVARVSFAQYEQAKEFCDEANAMKIRGIKC